MNKRPKEELQKLFSEALVNHQKGLFDKAEEKYKKILKINPKSDVVNNNLGLIYLSSSKKDLASTFFLKAIEINPNYLEAYNNLASLSNELGQYEKSIDYSKKALNMNPVFFNSLYNIAFSYGRINEKEKEIDFYKKALEINPQHFGSLFNLGLAYYEIGETKSSINYFKKANLINPEHIETKDNLACALLRHKDFQDGFDLFDARLKKTKFLNTVNNYNLKKLWQGQNLDNSTILILSEQGLGDVIQFVRYIYELKNHYKNLEIFFLEDKKIVYIFDKNKFKILTKKDQIPQHDYYTFIQSLPKYYYQRTNSLLQQNHYIEKNEIIFKKWKTKFSKYEHPKVGINWQGSKNYKYDKTRSIPLFKFATLFDLENIDYISLQKGYGEEQIDEVDFKNKLNNFSSEIDQKDNVFEDTIEIIRNLDLVITTCTAVAHLASTIGTETWILLSHNSDWRWFINDEKTPWYKNTFLIRQNKLNDWETVFTKVKEKLIKKFQL